MAWRAATTPAPEYPSTAYSLNLARTSAMVATGPVFMATSQILRRCDGLSATSLIRLSRWMLAVSVPLEISEYSGRTSTWWGSRTGSGTSSTMMSLSPLRITCFMRAGRQL